MQRYSISRSEQLHQRREDKKEEARGLLLWARHLLLCFHFFETMATRASRAWISRLREACCSAPPSTFAGMRYKEASMPWAGVAAMVVVAVGTEDMCALASSSDSDEPARFAAELTAQRKDLEALREAWSHGPHSKREVIPSRAWPDVQPEADELPALLSAKALCDAARAENGSAGVTKEGSKKEEELACARVTFDLGTALLGLPDRQEEGALLYKELAEAKFPDGMPGWGICLMEARGVSEDAPLACRWFESAAASASATTAGKKQQRAAKMREPNWRRLPVSPPMSSPWRITRASVWKRTKKRPQTFS